MEMITHTQAYRIANAMTGASRRVLDLMALKRERVSQGWLSGTSGLSENTVNKAVILLLALDLVQPAGRYAWRLTGEAIAYLALAGERRGWKRALRPARKLQRMTRTRGGQVAKVETWDTPAVEQQPPDELAGRKNCELENAAALEQQPPELADRKNCELADAEVTGSVHPAGDERREPEPGRKSCELEIAAGAEMGEDAISGRKNCELADADSREDDDAATRESTPLNDLKDLKDLKNTTTTNLKLIGSSSSNSDERQENSENEPEGELDLDDIGPFDVLDKREVKAFVGPYLAAPRSDQPGMSLFESEPFADVLEFLVQHTYPIANERFPIDDWLDTQARGGRQKINHGSYKLLYLAGVRGTKLLALSRLKNCSVTYVRAQMAMAQDRKDQDVRLLITRITDNDKAQLVRIQTGHLMKCQCEACVRASHNTCDDCKKWPCVCGRFDKYGKLL